MMARAKGTEGLTAREAARALFSVEKPTAAQTEKARRRLDSLVRSGELAFCEGDRATARASVWTFTNTFTPPSSAETHHAAPEPSRDGESEHETTFTDTFTTFTEPDL